MRRTLHRSVCLLLALSLVLGMVWIPAQTVQAESVTVYAAQDSILAEYIQDGCTLQCWNWSLKNIEANLGLIANMGYTSIQISPMQEAKEPTANRPYANWWALYQPVSFYINEQESHAIGTKDELIQLCEAAHKYDIKVIMDVICNHMANDGANVLCSQIQQDILSDPHCWHDYTVNSWDYSSRHNITQYCMNGLPDLNTANAKVQNYCLDLLKSYIDCGVDGFRFDGAKQIETPLDDSSFASNFWPTVVNGATSYAKQSRGISLYCYGELLGDPDDNNSLHISAYTDYMSVTDSVWSNDVRYRIDDNNAAGLRMNYFKNCSADKLVLWGESHDTYNDGSSSSVSMEVVNRAYAFVASRAYAMSLYYPRPIDMNKQGLGEIGKNGWTSAVVKAANRFHNHFVGQPEYMTQDGTENYYYNERGNSGIVIVNFNDGAREVDIPVYAMAAGTYTDQLTGNVFTVADGRITGQMGDAGIAIVYNPDTVSCSHTSHGTDGYCYDCYAYVGHSSGSACSVCGTASTRTFYFKNTDGWSNVYAYSWHDQGETVTAQWPGNAMSAVADIDGYYSITVPATATNVIFNNGDAVQTADLTAPAEGNTYDYSTGLWSTFGETGAPEYYYLHGYINGADYTGTDFTFVNGRLITTFTQDSYVYVQDSNGVTYMTDGWQGEVTSTTLKKVDDISSDPNKLFVPGGVVVTLTLTENVDGTLKLSFVASETSCEHPYHSTAGVCLSCGSTVTHSYVNGICSCGKYAPGSTRTVYFKNTAKWAPPYLYAWNDATEYTGAWPGTAMTLVDGETNIYELTIDADAVNVVFNNGASSKTNNLTLPTNGKNMFTVSSNSWSTYTPSGSSTTSTDYYLFGYINGADYACGDDSANLGIYKFVNGSLEVTFASDSYVGIKTGDNQTWYMTHAYVSSTTGTFFNTSTGASEKMLIPGGRKVTLTLKVNASGTLTLSYTADAPLNHNYASSVTTQPSCTTDGVRTYTCTICGDGYTERIPATGHSYSGGVCGVCGEVDPNYSADVDYYLFGFINGANYACEEDYENLGIYKFVDGKLTATFASDSYVAIKEGNNQKWYMAQSFISGTTGTFYNTADGASEKMLIPCGVEVSFTLTVNADGTLTLSYTTATAECNHSYTSKVTTNPGCTTAGVRTYTCSACGDSYTETVAATGHSYSGGVCGVCGEVDPNYSADVDYYLFGFINGANYACEEDYENLGIYKFVDGKLTATFASDSYVAIKEGNNQKWYMAQSYISDTTGTFYNTADGASEKMLIPGGVEVSFTLTVNADGTLTLSYTTATAECNHSYTSKVTTTPGCTTAGVRTYTCSACGDSYTETVAATGHSYAGGVCSVCGETDPNYSADVDYYLFGFINGANYACEEDWENLGEYKFENGTLTVTFEKDSYIGVRTNDNRWYMTQFYVSGNGGVFHNTDTGANEKMFVPCGGEVTFTLTVNPNDTLTVKYTAVNTCEHTYTSKVLIEPSCTVHGIETFTCTKCGSSYNEQIAPPGHSYVNGVCTVCGSKPVVHDYYLFGFINGMNYGCEDDHENLGQYKFVNGKLTATFTQDSYVGIKTEDNLNWYMTETFVESTSATFYNTQTGSAEKMLVPAGVEVTFTLTVHENDTLTVSYSTKGGCVHKYNSTISIAPSCSVDGARTYTCTLCGFSYSEAVPAVGHSYTGGVCSVCGAAIPKRDYYLFGSINGANYGCEEDYENLGEYKFVDGKLTATFTVDSYVAIKTGEDQGWYMTETFVTGTTATLYNTAKGTAEKMFVPGGVEITFTLTVNEDDSLTLSYATSTDCEHSYSVESIVDATCEEDGEIIYACTKCGDSFSELIPSMGHDYSGGYCTECGEKDPDAVTIPALRLSRASVSFEDEIWYNMYYTASGVEDVVEMGLLVFETQLADGKVSDAEQIIAGYDYDGTYYMTHTDGVAAKNMGDTLYYRVYAKLSDGSYAYSSNTVSYNAISYANSILRNSTNAYMKALVVAMLNYGAEAQTYFGYRTDSLMNAGLTAEHQALVRQYDADTMPNPGAVDSSKNGIFTKTGFGQSNITASFEAAFAMNYYVSPTYTPDGEVTLYYWTEEDYAAVTSMSPENASGAVVMTASGSQYWGAISGIAAKEMGKTIYAGAVYESGGVTYSTVVMNYSMGKYCDTIAGRESSAQRELSKAAAVYGASAKDYFDNL